MPLPPVCIVPRLMRSTSDRALRLLGLVTLLVATLSTLGCEQLDGRNRNKKGNRYFREMKFIDAVAEYEKALKLLNEHALRFPKSTHAHERDVMIGTAAAFLARGQKP